jgi:hypothetical protein
MSPSAARARALRPVALAGHIITGVGWLWALAYGSRTDAVWLATVAIGTGFFLALASPLGLVRYWWLVGKLAGSLVLVTLGVLALRGYLAPGARLAGCGVLCGLVWLSVARPGGKTPHGRSVTRRPRHKG